MNNEYQPVTEWGKAVFARLAKLKGETLTLGEAEPVLGASTSKLWHDAREGWLPAVDIARPGARNRCYRLAKADIREYVRRVEARV